MSKYTLIESELAQINDARFQVTGNAFLRKEYEGDIHSPGMVTGKEKTRKGRPDSFVFRKGGKFLLAEYTTKDKSHNKEKFLKKLEKDLLGCLDFENLGIEAKDVSEIVLCCNSDVDISEINKLREHTDKFCIDLRVVGIRTLTLHFLYKDRYFAHEFLGVPFDTGQILSKSEFIKQYNKRNFSTPLDNQLIGREKELEDLKEIIGANQITVVKGAPGTGKSKLVLEAIDEYLKDNSGVIAYYFMRKGGTLLEELFTIIELGKNYIFFIDDANRQLDNFLDAINSQLDKEKGEVKIVVTVRDYAKEEVLRQCRNLKPFVFTIDRLSDEDISKIVRGNDFNVNDPAIVNRIVDISKGNPRLAIMAVKIIKLSPDLGLLKDVSNIYDEYFQSIIDDKHIFTDVKILKVLGVISFLNSIDLEDENEKSIIDFFGFTYGEFVEVVHKLEEMEIVEVYQKYMVKMSEQVMSTYFFYKAFFKEALLSFSGLLNTYFAKYHWRLRDSFDPANAAFGEANVFDLAKSDLVQFYQQIKSNHQDVIQFLKVFGKYLPNTTFEFVNARIEELPEVPQEKLEVKKSKGYSSTFDFENILELLEVIYKDSEEYNVSLSVELSVAYLIKKPFLYDNVLKKLSENLQLTESDMNESFQRQRLIYNQLKGKIYNHNIYANLFYDLFSNVLLSRYYNNVFYEVRNKKWVLKPELRKIRNQFWTELTANYEKQKGLVKDVIMAYSETVKYAGAELFGDIPILCNLIDQCLEPASFEDCYVVHQYIHSAVERGINDKRLNLLKEKFANENFRIFSTLTWADVDLHELHVQFREWEKVERHKEELLQRQMHVTTIEEFSALIKCIHVILGCRFAASFNLTVGLDILFSSVINKDARFGLGLLKVYLSDGNVCRLLPGKLLGSIFLLNDNTHLEYFNIISTINFSDSDKWIERYFYFLPENLVNTRQIDNLLSFYKRRTEGVELYRNVFDKYSVIEPKISELILQNEVEKRKENKEYVYKLGYQFFKTNDALVKNNYLLCEETYFQQEEIDHRRDSDEEELFILFEINNNIIYKYLDFIYKKERRPFFPTQHKLLVKVWEYPNAEEIVKAGLQRFRSIPNYYVSDHMATIFFMNLDKRFHDRAYELLYRTISEYPNDVVTINMVLDIARNCLKEYYHKLIQHFVSINESYEIFSNLQFYNNHFSSNGDAIWADFKASELKGIYYSLKELPNNRKLLSHLTYLEQEISYEEKDALRERKLRFRGFR